MASKRSRGRVPNRYGPTVASDQRASEVAVFHVDPGLAARKDLSAADLRAHATPDAIEEPYRQYGRKDPRRRRGLAAELEGNWNIARTSPPRPVDNGHGPRP